MLPWSASSPLVSSPLPAALLALPQLCFLPGPGSQASMLATHWAWSSFPLPPSVCLPYFIQGLSQAPLRYLLSSEVTHEYLGQSLFLPLSFLLLPNVSSYGYYLPMVIIFSSVYLVERDAHPCGGRWVKQMFEFFLFSWPAGREREGTISFHISTQGWGTVISWCLRDPDVGRTAPRVLP